MVPLSLCTDLQRLLFVPQVPETRCRVYGQQQLQLAQRHQTNAKNQFKVPHLVLLLPHVQRRDGGGIITACLWPHLHGQSVLNVHIGRAFARFVREQELDC